MLHRPAPDIPPAAPLEELPDFENTVSEKLLTPLYNARTKGTRSTRLPRSPPAPGDEIRHSRPVREHDQERQQRAQAQHVPARTARQAAATAAGPASVHQSRMKRHHQHRDQAPAPDQQSVDEIAPPAHARGGVGHLAARSPPPPPREPRRGAPRARASPRVWDVGFAAGVPGASYPSRGRLGLCSRVGLGGASVLASRRPAASARPWVSGFRCPSHRPRASPPRAPRDELRWLSFSDLKSVSYQPEPFAEIRRDISA